MPEHDSTGAAEIRLEARRALRPALVYLAFGLVWILASDTVLRSIVSSPQRMTQLQTAKGWAFVGVSAFVIYALVRHEIRAILEREGRFRALVEQSLVGVCVIQENRFVYVNPKLAEMMGAPVASLLRLDPDEVFLGTQDPLLSGQPRSDATARDGVGVPHMARVRSRDGKERPVEVSTQDIEWHSRRAVIAIVVDHSEREALEQQLRHAQRMEAIGQLTGAIAHDFNNLLTTVIAPLELALEDVDRGSDVHAVLFEALQSANRAAQLSRKLLTFSRKRVSRPEVVEPAARIRDLTDMLGRLTRGGVTVELELNDGAAAVFIDPSLLEQVLVNLVVNANDAMPQGGTLTIRTTTVPSGVDAIRSRDASYDGPYVLIEVEDTGVGMDPATQRRAFEPFFTTKEAGTGLGLSTVFGIVEQAGGFIAIASTPGRGTTMRVHLPLYDPSGAPEQAAGRAESQVHVGPADPGGVTVVVVEEDASVRKLYARVLTRGGLRVLGAGSPDEALHLAKEHDGEIHLLITDVALRGMNGIVLEAEFRKQRPDVSVLYSVGYAEESVTRQLRQKSRFPILEKPFQISELREAIGAALGGGPWNAGDDAGS